MKKFNFLQDRLASKEFINAHNEAGRVHTRVNATDPHAGLRGKDYIKARQLDVPVKRIVPKDLP